jgi:hypothetical protein
MLDVGARPSPDSFSIARLRAADSISGVVITMTQRSSSVFLAGLLVLGLTAWAQAQGTQQIMPGSPAAVGGQQFVRGSPGTGTGVATGSGPLSRPIAPSPNRQWGPVQTNPVQQPFGR